jgi:Ca2+-binding RTX toxin-like protein
VATASLLQPFNPDAITWVGPVTAFTPSHIQISIGSSVFNYVGLGFTTDATGRLNGGTVVAMDYTASGSPHFQITDLNLSAAVLDPLLRANDGQAIQSFLFSGDDVIFGSPEVDRVNGSAGDDAIGGGARNDVLRGDIGNDLFEGGPGNDSIDGGPGLDLAFYSGDRGHYTAAADANGVHVSDGAGNEGSDTLVGVERVLFAASGLAFDLGPGEAAGNTVRIIGAAFDQPQIIPDLVGIGIELFDAGFSMVEVADLAINTPLFGSRSSFEFVNTVYQNVVGVLPTIAERDAYVALLQEAGGPLTRAELLVIAANSDLNAINIGLAGLQHGGVEFV